MPTGNHAKRQGQPCPIDDTRKDVATDLILSKGMGEAGTLQATQDVDQEGIVGRDPGSDDADDQGGRANDQADDRQGAPHEAPPQEGVAVRAPGRKQRP